MKEISMLIMMAIFTLLLSIVLFVTNASGASYTLVVPVYPAPYNTEYYENYDADYVTQPWTVSDADLTDEEFAAIGVEQPFYLKTFTANGSQSYVKIIKWSSSRGVWVKQDTPITLKGLRDQTSGIIWENLGRLYNDSACTMINTNYGMRITGDRATWSISRVESSYPRYSVNHNAGTATIMLQSAGDPYWDPYTCYFDLQGTYFVEQTVSNKTFYATLLISEDSETFEPMATYTVSTSGNYLHSYGPYDLAMADNMVKIVWWRWLISSASNTNTVLGQWETQGSSKPSGYHYTVELNLTELDPTTPTNQPPSTNIPPPLPPAPTNLPPAPTNYPPIPPNTNWPPNPIPPWPPYPYPTNIPPPTPDTNVPPVVAPTTNPAQSQIDFYNAMRSALRDEGEAFDAVFPPISNYDLGGTGLYENVSVQVSNMYTSFSSMFYAVDGLIGTISQSASNTLAMFPKNISIGEPLYYMDLVLSTNEIYTIHLDFEVYRDWILIFRTIIKWCLYIVAFFWINDELTKTFRRV